MDNDLAQNDPYNNMETGEEEILPDFLKDRNEAARRTLNDIERAATMKKADAKKNGGSLASTPEQEEQEKQKKNASEKQREASKNGKSGLYSGSGGGAKNGSGLYTGGGGFKNSTGTAGAKSGGSGANIPGQRVKAEGNGGIKAASPLLILLLAVVAIVGLIVGLPVIMIGAIDYNLQKALGFTETVGILEEQGEHVTAEMLGEGKVPGVYASDLANNGMLVGQVTAKGDFVQTDVYIADIESRNDLVAAASGYYYNSENEGELALLYDGEVIAAGDFVAAVESNPRLYAAYAAAADLSARYYYGKDVSQVYQEMGLSRGSFNEWEATGDYAVDEANYLEILNNVLDNKSNLVVGGVQDDDDDWTDEEESGDGVNIPTPENIALINNGTGNWQKDVSSGVAGEITSDVASKTKEYITGWGIDTYTHRNDDGTTETRRRWGPRYSTDSTERAAELLNTAVSAGEPYLAANAFMAIEEPIQRARIDGDGPVNEVMNTLTFGTGVTYQNVQTGQMETTDLAILETENFRAAVSDSSYSVAEAANFGRDRVLLATGVADANIIQTTTVGSNGQAKNNSVVKNGGNPGGDEAVAKKNATIAKANETINLSISQNNSDLFQSVVGANRILEGGSFLTNTINQHAIGAMPSSAGAIAEYHKEVEVVMARKAEAEQATLSPFDISSPNTFLGKIANNLAVAAIKSYGNSSILKSGFAGVLGTVARVAKNLSGVATAEGPDQEFTTMSGANCATVGTVEVEGDLYCTAHSTNSVKYMNYTRNDWKNSAIGGSIGDKNEIVKNSELEQFVTMAMDRYSTVGVRDAEVCEAYKTYAQGVVGTVSDFFANITGMYESCSGDVDTAKATGAAYTLGTSQSAGAAELYTGYMLYDQVYSLLSGETSSVAVARERYYKEHPRDNSEAGVVARISGLNKNEAEVALAYADYLNMIINYDSSSRYAFGAPEFDLDNEKSILEIHNGRMSGSIYAWRAKENEYSDIRNRTVVA